MLNHSSLRSVEIQSGGWHQGVWAIVEPVRTSQELTHNQKPLVCMYKANLRCIEFAPQNRLHHPAVRAFAVPVRACELTYADFQGRALRLLRSEYPGRIFDRGMSLEVITMGEVEFGLVNLRSKLCGASLSPVQQVEEIKLHFAAMMPIVGGESQPMPKTWEEVQNKVALQLVTTDYLRLTGTERVLVTRPFISGVVIGMVLDGKDAYGYVREEDRVAWGVSEEALYQQTLANLAQRSEQVEMRGGDGEDKFLAIETKDGYDAVRILVPWVRAEAAKFLGDPFVAAVPNRDFLIMWSSSNSSGFYDHARKNVEEDLRLSRTVCRRGHSKYGATEESRRSLDERRLKTDAGLPDRIPLEGFWPVESVCA